MDNETKLKLAEARKASVQPHYITEEEFDCKGEHFKRHYYNKERNLAIYERIDNLSGRSIACEVVMGYGNELRYPTTSQFGRYGWCYSWCRKSIELIKSKFHINFEPFIS